MDEASTVWVWYHLNISGLLWSTFKYNRNWITGYKIGSLYLIYCIVIRILFKNKKLYSREHLGGVFLNIVKLSLGVGAQIIKCFIYLQLFWNSSSLVLILPCFQINYWQPCFQRGFEILKRTIIVTDTIHKESLKMCLLGGSWNSNGCASYQVCDVGDLDGFVDDIASW